MKLVCSPRKMLHPNSLREAAASNANQLNFKLQNRYLETNSSNPATMSAAVAASDKWNNDVVIEGDFATTYT